MQKLNNGQILILDGAMGTMIQALGLASEKAPELLNLTHPDAIRSIYRRYLEAGSNIIYANTFQASSMKLGSDTAKAVIEAAIQDAKEEAAPYGALVGLDCGPLPEMMEPMGTLSFEKAYEIYKEMVIAGAKAGADLVAFETFSDLYMAKAALLAAKENTNLPVFVTMSFEEDGRTFTGCTIPSMAMTLSGLGADAIGMNCSVGPEKMAAMLEELLEYTDLPVIAKANAGLPDPVDGSYHLKAADYVKELKPAIEAGVAIIGGCCGTTPDFIAALKKEFGSRPVCRHGFQKIPAICTPTRFVRLDEIAPVGERINPTGKKRFQQALMEEDMDYILQIALAQADQGAAILDVNAGYPGVDEARLLPAIVKAIQSVLDVPLMLDSKDPKALENALRIYNGKPIVNSIDGTKESQEAILPLVKKYGAAVVGLSLDEDGIPDSAEKRVRIAEQMIEALAAYGIDRSELVVDPLTLTVSAQQDQARETLKALGIITNELNLSTVLGVSNISFGLPERPVIIRTFLDQALYQGLKLPIINPSSQGLMDGIAAARVLDGQDKGAAEYIARFANAPVQKSPEQKTEQDLESAILSGLKKEAAAAALKELETMSELELVEKRLIPALDEAGRRYEAKTLFLPQLLSAAGAAQSVFEVIKERLSEKGEKNIEKGTIVLATVKGDIHDIGKNIVKTVLENYGYRIMDLGRDVNVDLIVRTVKDHGIRLVGLSALMTTTLGAMEETVKALKALNNPPEIMVGGAVVTPDYAKKIGADYYCQNAQDDVAAAREVFGD